MTFQQRAAEAGSPDDSQPAERSTPAADSGGGDAFGHITGLALALLEVDAAVVTLPDGASGMTARRPSIEPAGAAVDDAVRELCRRVTSAGRPLLLNDVAELAAEGIPFDHLPVRALLTVPLRARNELRLGSLCVMQHTPRQWSDADVAALEGLARLAATEIELHSAMAASHRQSRELDRERQARTSLLEQLPDGFFAVGRDWRLRYLNRRAEALMGRPAAELVGRRLWDEFPALHGNRFEEQLERAQAERVRVEFEEHNPGDGHWYGVTAYPMDDGLVVYFRDVTDRHRVDAKVARYREVFAHSQDAIAILDTSGRYLEQNEAHRRLTGYSDEELRDTTVAAHLGEEAVRRMSESLTSTGSYRGEEEGRDKHGRSVIVDLSVFAVRDGGTGEQVCYVGVARDITERRRLEEKERALIREQAARAEAEAGRRRMMAMLESVTDAFFALDADWRFSYLNGQAEVLLQRGRDELIGRSVWDELRLDRDSALRSALEAALAEHTTVDLEALLPHL